MRKIHVVELSQQEWQEINEANKTFVVVQEEKIEVADLIQFQVGTKEVNDLFMVKYVEHLQLQQITIISIIRLGG